ncbi:MAG TPA: phosphoethanolamine--lipid A transferase [Burkholderiales bacterium]|nr:phosphoethanolamine--lipid A transferase [Burkholderiales bacterium]
MIIFDFAVIARWPRLQSWSSAPLALSAEVLALWTSLFFTLACNDVFWAAFATARDGTWWLALRVGVFLIGLHWLLLLLVINRWTVKPILISLVLLTSAAVYFLTRYRVYLDASMLRNLLETDVNEVSELLDWRMLPYAGLYGAVPAWLLYRARVQRTSWRLALRWRLACLALATLLAGGGLWSAMYELAPTVRAHGELRHLVTPLNYISALVKVLPQEHQRVRAVIAPDARRSAAATRKPIAFVLVVGETVRAANWGLNGYSRQTTPELAAHRVINFTHTTSCGTDTATSVPCMFSVHGRRNYNEKHIRSSESLLHVLSRVGVSVLWRDNQAGCKGVCDGLPFENIADTTQGCSKEHCADALLLQDLKGKIAAARGDVLIVLHMLGNHGPAYYQRYPVEFRRWQPTCDTTDLVSCSREALVNTYDNAIGYTDHVLAQAIDILSGVTSHDTAMLYVSDHGESLGEHNLYLHGMPYLIAPKEQTQVPMDLWLSRGFAASTRLDTACLAKRATLPVSHDHLFHTVMRMFDVESTVYDPVWDFAATCRRPLSTYGS